MIRLAIFLLLLPVSTLRAQFPDFYVDLYVGEVLILKQGQKKTLPVKQKMLLFPGDKIIIKTGESRISLVNKENKYLDIARKGTFQISEIAKMEFAEPHSVTKKYFELVWEELLDPGAINTRDKSKKITGTWGGIIRGNCDQLESPANNSVVKDYWVNFSWKRMPDVSIYRFSIYNESDNLIHQYLIKDTSFSIAAKGFVSRPINIYYWQVEAEELSSKVTCKAKLTWLTDTEYAKQTDAIITTLNKSDPKFLLNASVQLFNNGFYKLAQEYFAKMF